MSGAPPGKAMKLLLTNDDGINSPGLLKLADALRSRGHSLTVIAPDSNRSGISHAITILNGPVKLNRLGDDTWSCAGTPGDCVIVGVMGKLPGMPEGKPDLVLSGINQGENMGTDLIYSGTAGAARQASLFGLPAIALSLAGWDGYFWDMAASWSADHLEEFSALWRRNTFVNVNIPNRPGGPEGIKKTWPSVKRYRDSISIMKAQDGVSWAFLEGGEDGAPPEAGTDSDVVSGNYASVSSVFVYPVVRKDLCPGVPDYASVAPRPGD